MSTQTLTETTGLADMEYSPVCETQLFNVFTGKITYVCDKPATQVLIFHSAHGCSTRTELNCDDCVEYAKTQSCPHCGKPQYISSMPIGDK